MTILCSVSVSSVRKINFIIFTLLKCLLLREFYSVFIMVKLLIIAQDISFNYVKKLFTMAQTFEVNIIFMGGELICLRSFQGLFFVVCRNILVMGQLIYSYIGDVARSSRGERPRNTNEPLMSTAIRNILVLRGYLSR